jgi:hypothetical protein
MTMRHSQYLNDGGQFAIDNCEGKVSQENLRVPCKSPGQRRGLFAMLSTARFISAVNFSAAARLRSKYQSIAARIRLLRLRETQFVYLP